MKIENLKDLLLNHMPQVHPSEKKVKIMGGNCVFCNTKFKEGYAGKEIFGTTFMNWQDLNYGQIVCFDCCRLYLNENLRKRSWIGWINTRNTQDHGFLLIQRLDIKRILSTINENWIWSLYVTESHQKNGWIRGFRSLNHNKSNFVIIYEDYLLYANHGQIEHLSEIVEIFLNLLIPKSVILLGTYSSNQLQIFYSNVKLYQIYEELQKYSNSPILKFVLFITDKQEEQIHGTK